MEEQIKRILYKIFSVPNDDNEPREAEESLDAFSQDPQFYFSLFTLFRNVTEPQTIRLMSIFVLKRQIKYHWNEFSKEFQEIFLSNITNLILGITTKEPFYYPHVVEFTYALISLSFNEYFNNFWKNNISELLNSGEDQFFAGLIFLNNVLKIVSNNNKIPIHKRNPYLEDPNFKESFIQFLCESFQKVTSIYSQIEINLFLRTQFLLTAIYSVNIFGPICQHDIFISWYQSFKYIISEQSTLIVPFDRTTVTSISKLLELYILCQGVNKSEEVPFSSQLLLFCFNIMYRPFSDGENKSPLFSLIINVFQLFMSLFKCPTVWESHFLPRINDIMEKVFSPVFSIPASKIELVVLDPAEFINDYHVDGSSSLRDYQREDVFFDEDDVSVTPLSIAVDCLRQMCKSHPEIHEYLFSIASSTLSSFMANPESRNFLNLYSVFHMVSAYWEVIVELHFKEASEFMDSLIPLFRASMTDPASIAPDPPSLALFQSSLLLIISRANPWIDLEKQDPIPLNPVYVETAILLLDSQSPLVKNFATFSIYKLLCNSQFDQKMKDGIPAVLKVCVPNALKIINCLIEYAHDNCQKNVTEIIWVFMKNNEILESVMGHLEFLIDSVFEIAFATIIDEQKGGYSDYKNLPSLFNSLITLISDLYKFPQELDKFCIMIFKKCLDTFSTFCNCCEFYNLIGIILCKSPNYYNELYNSVFQPIVSFMFTTSVDFDILGEIALIFHNMMLRSPEFIISMNSKSVHNIINSEESNDGNSILEIASFIIDNWNDVDHVFYYFSSLLFIFDPAAFSVDFIERFVYSITFEDVGDLFNKNYYPRTCYDTFLIFLKKFPQFLFQTGQEELIDVYFEAMSFLDEGCGLAFIGQFMPVQKRNMIIRTVVNLDAEALLGPSQESWADDDNYESDYKCVIEDKAYIPVFSVQQKFVFFQDYLRKISSEEPDFIQSLNLDEKMAENLMNILHFQPEQIPGEYTAPNC